MSSHSHKPCGRRAVMLLAVVAVLCSVGTFAAAQDQPAPKWELFGGYSFVYPGADVHGLLHARIGISAAWGFVVAAALFPADLSLRQFAGHSLFPYAAPTGGTLLILSWLALAVAAAWPRRAS